MVHIRKIKTWYGVKYAVVEPMTVYSEDEKGNLVSWIEHHAVEYQVGDNERNVKVATFPVTREGLQKAKEIQRLFKK